MLGSSAFPPAEPMDTLNPRQLEIFSLLMKTRSLTEAARLLNVSQPAISRALKELEAQLGFELFYRVAGRVRPTTEAMQFLPEIERLFAHLGMVSFKAAELRDRRAGNLVVATIPMPAVALLPRAIEALRLDRPRMHCQIHVYTGSEVIRLVKQETAELGFIYTPLNEPAVAAEPVLQTRLHCLFLETHPLAQRRVVRAADLDVNSTIVFGPQTPPGVVFNEHVDRQRMRRLAMVETNSSLAAVSLVRAGFGVALIDPMAILTELGAGLAAVPFEPEIPLTLAVLFSRHRPMSRPAVEFLSHLRKVAAACLATSPARELFTLA
jgi:DNA-binding transcriptional LysR family regulator